jgi:hypothetical protein
LQRDSRNGSEADGRVKSAVYLSMGARGHDFTVTQVTGALPALGHDARAQTAPNGEHAMFNPSDLLLTRSDFAKIARAPEVVLTISFMAMLIAFFSAAAVFA